MNDMNEIERMTIYEYQLRMKAYKFRYLDQEAAMHKLAWITQQAGASKKNGKPVFRTFKKFFDYEKARKQLFDDELEKPKLLNNRVMDYLRKKKEGEEDGKL